jgi:serine protease
MREPIRGQYLVMLENEHGRNVTAAAAALMHRYGGKVDREFHAASTGFAITMTDGQAIGLSHDPMVRFVEEVAVVHLSSEQTSAPYWLDRLDSSYDGKYWYCEKGADVTAYVIDTGIWEGHSEFQTNGASRCRATHGLPGLATTS